MWYSSTVFSALPNAGLDCLQCFEVLAEKFQPLAAPKCSPNGTAKPFTVSLEEL